VPPHFPKNVPIPVGEWDPHLIHGTLGPSEPPFNEISIVSSQFCKIHDWSREQS